MESGNTLDTFSPENFQKAFKSCKKLNAIRNTPPTWIGKLNISTRCEDLLTVLAIMDSMHDYSQSRGTKDSGYDPETFNSKILKYLMTGSSPKNEDNKNVFNIYKAQLLFKKYGHSVSAIDGLEPKVAAIIEHVSGLQPVVETISYNDILDNTEIDGNMLSFINDEGQALRARIMLSNNSLKLSRPSSVQDKYEIYMHAKYHGNVDKIKKANIHIAKFIKWYLYGTRDTVGSASDEFAIPEGSIKFLADAGMSFLTHIFCNNGSGAQLIISPACFMDSAGTSTDLLDKTMGNFYETKKTTLVPMFSNYFSCDKYFFCYIFNSNEDYGVNGPFKFSFAICDITNMGDDFGDIVNKIKTSVYLSHEYTNACEKAYYAIEDQKIHVTRYYFGNGKGTCGSGVRRNGTIMNELVKTNPEDKAKMKKHFNTKFDVTKGNVIPFGDGQIFNLFNGNQDMKQNFNRLYDIITDYKRMGDYHQAYTSLKLILDCVGKQNSDNGTNTDFITGVSGDRLSALVFRLLGVPVIFQTACNSTCYLYRCDKYNTTVQEFENIAKQNAINNFIASYKSVESSQKKYNFFVTNNYYNICKLHSQLLNYVKTLEGRNKVVLKISILGAIDVLSNIIELTNINTFEVKGVFLEEKLKEFLNKVKLNTDYTVNDVETANLYNQSLSKIIIANKEFQIINYLNDNLEIFGDVFTTEVNVFKQIVTSEGTFSLTTFGIFVKKHNDVNKETRDLQIYIDDMVITNNKFQELRKLENILKNNEDARTKTKLAPRIVVLKKEIETKNKNFLSKFNKLCAPLTVTQDIYDGGYEELINLIDKLNESLYDRIDNIQECNVAPGEQNGGKINDGGKKNDGGKDYDGGKKLYELNVQVKQLALNVLNKCFNYMIDVGHVSINNSAGDNFAGDNSACDKFCEILLFATDDESVSGYESDESHVSDVSDVSGIATDLGGGVEMDGGMEMEMDGVEMDGVEMEMDGVVEMDVDKHDDKKYFRTIVSKELDITYNMGLITGLNLLTNRFYKSDFNNVTDDKDDVLTLSELLQKTDCNYINLIIYLLSFKKSSVHRPTDEESVDQDDDVLFTLLLTQLYNNTVTKAETRFMRKNLFATHDLSNIDNYFDSDNLSNKNISLLSMMSFLYNYKDVDNKDVPTIYQNIDLHNINRADLSILENLSKDFPILHNYIQRENKGAFSTPPSTPTSSKRSHDPPSTPTSSKRSRDTPSTPTSSKRGRESDIGNVDPIKSSKKFGGYKRTKKNIKKKKRTRKNKNYKIKKTKKNKKYKKKQTKSN